METDLKDLDWRESPFGAEIQSNLERLHAVEDAEFPLPKQTRIITFANQKGGVGKTTSTVNVSAALAKKGAKTLVIDLDPQGNASTALNIPHSEGDLSIYNVLSGEKSLSEVIQNSKVFENLFVAASSIDLAGAEIELMSLPNREHVLETAIISYLESLKSSGEQGFDYIIIDCPPSLGLLVLNALVASKEVVMPIQAEYYALEGLGQLTNTINLIRQNLNPELEISAIIITMFDRRTNLSAEVENEVRSHFPELVLRTHIPRNVKVSEAPSFNETILEYDPTSIGAISYMEVAYEISLQNNKIKQSENDK